MFFDPDDCFYDSDDDYGGGYSYDDYDYSSQGISVPRYTYIKDGRVHSGDHADKFRKCLHDLFLSSNYCDVTLVTNTTTFKAHKVVLAANSAYFHAMFSSTCSEALQSVVSFKDNPFVTSTGLSAILEYAYLGSFKISHSTVRDILEVARHLLLEDVTKSCEKFIQDITIKQDNYVELFETAREFGLKGVEERIERFLEQNEVNLDNYLEMIDFATASNSDAVLKNVITFISQELHYLMLSKELLDIMDAKILLAMVKADTHGFFTDMTLIDFIVKWAETSPEDRLPVLSDVIKEINLLCFEVEALGKIANLPFFKEDEKVKEQISEAKSHLLEVKGRCTEDGLYVFGTSNNDVKFHCLASESVITKKRALYIRSHRHHREISMSYGLSVIAVGDILFLIGELISLANGGKGCLCFSYDPARNVWKEHASLPSRRWDYRLVAYEGEVYAIGGLEYNCSVTNRVDVYDFIRDDWRDETPLPRAFSSLTTAALNGSIYVYGHGRDSIPGGGSSTAFLQYDRNRPRKRWAVKPRPTICSDCYGDFHIGHLVACSEGLYQITNDSVMQHLYRADLPALGVQFYDPSLNHWEYSTLYHTFDDFDIKVVLSRMDDMYIIAKYTKKSDDVRYNRYGTKVTSLFRFNEAAWKMELLKEDFPYYDELNVALVSIPKASISRCFDS